MMMMIMMMMIIMMIMTDMFSCILSATKNLLWPFVESSLTASEAFVVDEDWQKDATIWMGRFDHFLCLLSLIIVIFLSKASSQPPLQCIASVGHSLS